MQNLMWIFRPMQIVALGKEIWVDCGGLMMDAFTHGNHVCVQKVLILGQIFFIA